MSNFQITTQVPAPPRRSGRPPSKIWREFNEKLDTLKTVADTDWASIKLPKKASFAYAARCARLAGFITAKGENSELKVKYNG